jgi:RimJ/RimL family protein N-acetyltransferase
LSPDGVRGKGIAFAAMILVCRYIFDELGMNRVVGHILEDNFPSLRFAERFGMVREGVQRQAIFKNGRFKNLIIVSMLMDEFYQKYGTS